MSLYSLHKMKHITQPLLNTIFFSGSDTTIKNNAKRTPYDLAKDPECGRLLRGAIGNL